MPLLKSVQPIRSTGILTWVVLFGAACVAAAQPAAPPKPGPDVLLFSDGERLTGQFVKSTEKSLTFKSDALGEITVDWSKVRELQSSAKVAVIPKSVKLKMYGNTSNVPQGTLSVQDQTVHLTDAQPPAPAAIPLSDTSLILDQAEFNKAMTQKPRFFEGWKGPLTIGASLVRATQNSETFTGALSLTRAIPGESWLEPRNRTILDLNASYGEVTQPATPTIKTAIFHGDLERDEYFSPRWYGFGQGAFDHNFSQGLDLQQAYSGGVGWTVIERANQTLDLKGSMSYVRQQFHGSANEDLIGSTFAEDYNRKFARGLVWTERLTLIPTWNNTSAYSAIFNTLLTLPVYKRIGGSIGFIDSYLNNPPAGFKKNSVQVTLGLTYTVQ